MKLLFITAYVFASLASLAAAASGQTPVYRPSATPPVYQPKTAPSPIGTPTMTPPVYTAEGPQAPKLAKESLVGTWDGTGTLAGTNPIRNGFRFVLTNGVLSAVWLSDRDVAVPSRDISLTENMFVVVINDPAGKISFVGYIDSTGNTMKGTMVVDTMGEKMSGTWTAKRIPATTTAATPKELVDHGLQAMGQKDLEGALKLFTQALDADPNYIDAYRFRAIAALQIYEQYPAMNGQKLYTALYNLDDAIKRGSNNPDDLYLRGYTHEKLGHKEKAIADYRAALKSYSNHQKAREALVRLGERI